MEKANIQQYVISCTISYMHITLQEVKTVMYHKEARNVHFIINSYVFVYYIILVYWLLYHTGVYLGFIFLRCKKSSWLYMTNRFQYSEHYNTIP